jgi:hypothetical protein
MLSGSINVMFITLGGFTLFNHFCQLFEALTAVSEPRQAAFDWPIVAKLYTKAAVKANPPACQAGRVQGWISTPASCRRFHLA